MTHFLLTDETVRSWYYKKRFPQTAHLVILCRVLDCDANYLLGLCEDTTQDRHFICEQTGLSERTVRYLQNGHIDGVLFDPPSIIPHKNAIEFLIGNEHGRSVLESIMAYLNSEPLKVSINGTNLKYDEGIVFTNTKTGDKYNLSGEDFDNVLLLRIQSDLVLIKDSFRK